MASRRTITLKSEENTGFGNNSSNNAGRFVDKRRGKANIRKTGVSLLEKYSWYHTMLETPRGKFLFLLFMIYILINLVFAGIYYMIGIDHLAGVNKGSGAKNFSEVFFFSAQ